MGLSLDEISLVDRGANRKKILLTKRDQDTMPKLADKVRALDEKARAKCAQSVAALIAKANEDELPPLSPEAAEALETVARVLTPVAAELTDAHLDALQEQLGIEPDPDEPEEPPPPPPVEKAEPEEDPQDEDPEPEQTDEELDPEETADGLLVTANKPEDMSQEEFDNALKAARLAFAAAISKSDYNEAVHKSAEDPMPKDALSAFTPAQRAALAAIRKADQAEKKQLVQKLEAQERELAERRERDVVRKCEDDAAAVPHLPKDKVVSVLKSLRAAGQAEAADQVLALMQHQGELVEKAAKFGGDLYNEMGSSQAAAPADSPEGRIETLVREEVSKSAGKKTYEQAYARVIRSGEGKRLSNRLSGRG